MEPRLGVIQHRECAVAVGKRSDRLHIGDLPGGCGRRFKEYQPGRSGCEHSGKAGMVRQRQQRVRHAEPRQRTPQQLTGRPIAFHERDDMIALPGQREQHLCDGVDPRGAGEAVLPALQFGEQQFELSRARIGHPAVVEPRSFAACDALGLGDRGCVPLDVLLDGRIERAIVRRDDHERWVLHARRRRSRRGFICRAWVCRVGHGVLATMSSAAAASTAARAAPTTPACPRSTAGSTGTAHFSKGTHSAA